MMVFFNSRIGPVPLDVIISERHNSSIGITELPIETGAKITDHSYVEPKKLELSFADCGAALTYMALVRFQETRVPFSIISGLNIYTNMLIRDINAERDEQYSKILKGTALLQEVILVSTAKVASEEGGSTKSPNTGTGKDNNTIDRTDGPKPRGDQPTQPNQSVLHKYVFGHEPGMRVSTEGGGMGGV